MELERKKARFTVTKTEDALKVEDASEQEGINKNKESNEISCKHLLERRTLRKFSCRRVRENLTLMQVFLC